MQKRTFLSLAVCCALGLVLTATACGGGPSGATGEQEKASPTLTAKGMDYTQQIDNLKKRAEEYTPEVITNAEGVQIQLVPDSPTNYLLGNEAGYDHNVYYINGNNRGCNSCHTTGLYDLVNNGIVGHVKLDMPQKSDLTIENCIQCHEKYGLKNADLFHGIHLGHFDGDCNSCHVVSDYEFTLWDKNKFDVLDGFTKLDDKKVDEGQFTYDQTTTGDPMSVDWTFDKFEIDMFNNQLTNKATDDDTYNNWEITFKGAVNQEQTIKLTDLISRAEQAGAVKEVELTLGSGDCYNDSGLIGTAKYKGIDFNWIMQQVGVRSDAIAVGSCLPNGSNVSDTIDVNLINANAGSYLVYEVNGQKLSWQEGYPCRFISSVYEASGSGKWVHEFDFMTNDDIQKNKEYLYLVSQRPEYSDFAIQPMTKDAKPFVGFSNLYDGQVVDKDFQLEGYAYMPNYKVTSIELSFDRGKTWKKMDVSNTENGKWVYWKYKRTYDPGSYMVSVRATFENGTTAQTYTDKAITVK